VPDEAAKSIGSEETFGEDVRGAGVLSRALLDHAGRVGRRLRSAQLAGRTITLKVKYADFTLVTRRVTLPWATDDDRAIHEAAVGLLARVDVERPTRLVGVSVSGFAGASERGQLDLFGAPAAERPPDADRRRALNSALDALAERFGDRAVTRADLAEREGEGD
jgi:DNA polymerase-4